MGDLSGTGCRNKSICEIFPPEILKIIVKKLPELKEKLNLRHVNSIMKAVTDYVLQEATASFWHPYIIASTQELYSQPGNTFRTADQVIKFIFAMNGSAGNPFPTRHIIFSCVAEYTDFTFHSVPSLLSSFGKHITSITYIRRQTDPKRMREMCRTIFKNVPDLKCFRIFGEERGVDEVSVQELQPVFPPLPLPHFVNLSILDCDKDPIVGVADGILSTYGKQIKSFECTGLLLAQLTHFISKNVPVPALKELKVNFVDTLIVSLIACSQRWGIQLKRLSVVGASGDVDVGSLLQMITRFSSTLEELCLDLSCKDISIVTADIERFLVTSSEVSFPLLKKLVISTCLFCLFLKNQFSNVLEWFNALKYLEIIHYSYLHCRICFNNHLMSVRDTPDIAWRKFPLLQTISFFKEHNPGILRGKVHRPKWIWG